MREYPALAALDAVIVSASLYRLDTNIPRHFSFGDWLNRQHAVLRLQSEGQSGWGENIISINHPETDLASWGVFLQAIKGMTIAQAVDFLDEQGRSWDPKCCEMATIALADLAGKVCGRPAAELLGLTGASPVPGVHCILENDPSKAALGAETAKAHGFTSHLKIKLYGDPALDTTLIQTVRNVMAPGLYLIGDVNCGYGTEQQDNIPDSLLANLRKLHAAYLCACEDPAYLSNTQWVQVQEAVAPLALIPDYCMRPSYAARKTILPHMGKVYNIHPGCTGSIFQACLLAQDILATGAGLMIGDDSLIGPSCTVWQQLAIGLGADWVEALEKPQESDPFLACVTGCATYQDDAGRIAVHSGRPGFGLVLDEDAFEKICSQKLDL